jgi:hypothetical protein
LHAITNPPARLGTRLRSPTSAAGLYYCFRRRERLEEARMGRRSFVAGADRRRRDSQGLLAGDVR